VGRAEGIVVRQLDPSPICRFLHLIIAGTYCFFISDKDAPPEKHYALSPDKVLSQNTILS
jgi:hypothetical protein